jgi:hypothetical protein
LDAVIFLRFLRMLRNIFLVITVIGCGILIPVNVVGGHSVYKQWGNIATLMKVRILSELTSALLMSEVHAAVHFWT